MNADTSTDDYGCLIIFDEGFIASPDADWGKLAKALEADGPIITMMGRALRRRPDGEK